VAKDHVVAAVVHVGVQVARVALGVAAQRKLKLKAKLESGSSHFGFKR